jgi:hypothetical protein
MNLTGLEVKVKNLFNRLVILCGDKGIGTQVRSDLVKHIEAAKIQ